MKLGRATLRVVLGLASVRLATLGIGCGSFEPMSYLSRNACDFLNCEVMFFIPELFPLSAPPMNMDMSGGAAVVVEEAEEEGGHMH